MCTAIRFTDVEGNMFFGRNLDWSCGYGQHVLVTPRDYMRKWAFGPNGDAAFGVASGSGGDAVFNTASGPNGDAAFGATTDLSGAASGASPVMYGGEPCEHAVMGMGIAVDNTPLYFDCANEAGLGIAGLNFPGYAQFEEGPVAGKINVAAYEFPLWVVSCFESVDELERVLDQVAIVAKPVSEEYPVSLLHWIVCDGKRSIVIEYAHDGMHVHRNDFDVLANQPTFDWHAENIRNYLSLTSRYPKPVEWGTATLEPYGSGSGMRGIPGDYYSPSRFVRAAYLNTNYPTVKSEGENVLRMFHTLCGVAMIDGAAQMANGFFERTVYTGGYSANTRTYYYNEYEDPAIKYVSLADVDVSGADLMVPEPKLWPALA